MSQNDFSIANQAFPATRTDINSALQALATLSSGATAPSTTYAYQLWADTTNNVLKQRNAANSGWIVRATLAEVFAVGRSSNTILGLTDHSKTIIATASFTQTLTAAATLGDGWFVDIVVDSGVTLTLDPNASETIDGATTKAITGPAQGRVVCNGTLFRTLGFVAPPSQITAALGADVSLNNTANYFDGPSVAQGTSGTWFAWGTVTVRDATAGANNIHAKLWDGTTLIASGSIEVDSGTRVGSIALSGFIASPAGNLRISVRDSTTTSGLIKYDVSGNAKDSFVSAIRIA